MLCSTFTRSAGRVQSQPGTETAPAGPGAVGVFVMMSLKDLLRAWPTHAGRHWHRAAASGSVNTRPGCPRPQGVRRAALSQKACKLGLAVLACGPHAEMSLQQVSVSLVGKRGLCGQSAWQMAATTDYRPRPFKGDWVLLGLGFALLCNPVQQRVAAGRPISANEPPQPRLQG